MKYPLQTLILCLLSLMLAACSHTPLKFKTETTSFALDIKEWHHQSGAKILYVHAPELPMVDIRIVLDAGAAKDGRQFGIANLTNALLEEGTKSYTADEIAEGFENIGAVFYADSYRDMTFAHLRSLTDKDKLDTALTLFTEVVTAPAFGEKAFNRVKTQLLTTIKQQDESPGTILSQAFYQALYQEHPYGHPTYGTKASINQLTADDVKAFHQQYYVTKNMTIVVVGDVTKAQVQDITDKLLANARIGVKPKATPSVIPSVIKNQHITFDSTQTHIQIGALGVNRYAEDYPALYVGNHILGGSGLVSILSEEVREKEGLTYGIISYFIPMRAEGPFIINLQTRQEQADKALDITQKTLLRFLEHGPTEEQLTHAKKNLLGSYALRTANNKALVDQIAMMGFYELPLDHLSTTYQKIQDITLDDINTAFKRVLSEDKLFTITVGKGS